MVLYRAMLRPPRLWRSFAGGCPKSIVSTCSFRQNHGVSRRPSQVRRYVSSGKVITPNVVIGNAVTPQVMIDRERFASTAAVEEEAMGAGVKYDGVVEKGGGRVRLDQWISRQLPLVSRARVQNSIRLGLALVNGVPANKASFSVKGGDHVQCSLVGPSPSEAKPEDIELDIAYEDEHLLVINKPANMVVHPAPGHSSGTLVNALLHHSGLSLMPVASAPPSQKVLLNNEDNEVPDEYNELIDDGDDNDDLLLELPQETFLSGPPPVIRPGIVHRLDKGTSGLLVIAKDDYTHEHLSDQFKARTVRRSYLGLTCGLPPLGVGRVDVPIGRDPRDRKRMAAFPFASAKTRTRSAASKYCILEILGQGGCALVEWRLETGRTHQIRVHAQHLGYPLLGDEIYGGTKGAALNKLIPRCPSGQHGFLRHLVSQIKRPCLHAQTLGFIHPWTGDDHNFECAPPDDFEAILEGLRQCGSTTVKY